LCEVFEAIQNPSDLQTLSGQGMEISAPRRHFEPAIRLTKPSLAFVTNPALDPTES
jgi:hypothetical protein